MPTHGNDDDDNACSDENGEDENCRNGDNDRVFNGEELESYTYSADIRIDELSVDMETGATIIFAAAASMPNRESFPTGVEPREFDAPGSTQVGNDSRADELSDGMETGATILFAAAASMPNRELVHTNTRADVLSNNMETGATIIFAAAAPIPNRESFPTGVEPREFDAPGSTQVGNDSRSEDLLEECVAATNSTICEGLSLAPSFEEGDWERMWEHDLLSSLRVDSVDVANIPTEDAVEPSTSFTTNTADEPAQQPSMTYPEMVEAAGIFLRTHVKFLPEEYVDGLVQSMVRSFIDDGRRFVRNIPDQMMRYFISLFGRKEWPNTLEHLHTWLLHWVQPAAPIVGDGENSKKPEAKSGKKRSDSSSANNEKKKKGPYRCPLCGQIKVSWNGTIRIPHACPIKDQGTEMQSGIEGSDHDIDGVLKNNSKKYTVLYASHPVDGNGNDGDGDQKPAAIVRPNTATASISTASSRSTRASIVESLAHRQVRPVFVSCRVVVFSSVCQCVCMHFCCACCFFRYSLIVYRVRSVFRVPFFFFHSFSMPLFPPNTTGPR